MRYDEPPADHGGPAAPASRRGAEVLRASCFCTRPALGLNEGTRYDQPRVVERAELVDVNTVQRHRSSREAERYGRSGEAVVKPELMLQEAGRRCGARLRPRAVQSRRRS